MYSLNKKFTYFDHYATFLIEMTEYIINHSCTSKKALSFYFVCKNKTKKKIHLSFFVIPLKNVLAVKKKKK